MYLRTSEFHGECPKDPTEQTCGLAAAKWLVRNELIYIDVEPIDKTLDATADETPGVYYDGDSTQNSLELVDHAAVGETDSYYAAATFGCLACSKWVRVSLEPFNSFGIDVIEP